ncbi:type VI secretion system Vgr family protein [Shewanella surugensis]|uniref:Type VI secretion system tip protein VgrG n=1 Tax=Shewanella surugensis TaxID=212020 RepID=A0ABT0L9U0_9GAMM|nr:type VI secretion system tip protein TssI/VgrG [Shewanella surugensis]MCL1124451.1 type VI secretion system tip protein VgrG [Shewanella surugensis]
MTLAGSGLRYQFTSKGLDEDSFDVVNFHFTEALSTPFMVELVLLSRKSDLTPESIVDQSGLLSWAINGEITRQINGIVSQFTKGDTGHHHTQYKVTLVPALSRLKLRHNSRIFQAQSSLAIIKTLLTEMGITDHAFNCDPSLDKRLREYCVQYRESDFDFISRLAAEEGLIYHFEHEKTKHTLVFSDSTKKLSKLGLPFPYNVISGGVSDVPFVNHFELQHQVRVAKVALKDASFKKPQYSFLQESTATDMEYQAQSYQHFDFPGRYKDDESGKPFTQTRLEYLRRDALDASGSSNIMAASVGYKFDLMEHIDQSFNRDWLLTQVTHRGVQGASAEEANSTTPTTYNNTFHVIPANTPWQAAPKTKTKPLVSGPQSAVVVGPKGEEIFCDEHGRVKLQFPWDREGKSDEQASCWVQVSQGWAGAQYGMTALPRIGHQVIVSFLEGDPDQPIITGRTFHATNVPPYVLPSHKTRTVIKTQTHKGEGFNELRFEDEASREQVFVHGQKDLDIIVRNTRRENTGMDHHLTVENEQFAIVKQSKHSTVGKDLIEEVRGDKHQAIGKNFIQKVTAGLKRIIGGGMVTQVDGAHSMSIVASEEKTIGGDQKIEVNKDSYLKASNIVLEAGTALTIKGPGGFIKIDSGGVTISGSKVKINEGGSPGKGSAPKAAKPEEPNKPTLPEPADKR